MSAKLSAKVRQPSVLSVTGFSLISNQAAYMQQTTALPVCSLQHRLAAALDIAGADSLQPDSRKILAACLVDLFVAEADSQKAEAATRSLLSAISDTSDMSASYEVAYGKGYFADCKKSGEIGKQSQPMLVSLFKMTVAEVKAVAESIIVLRETKAKIQKHNLYTADVSGNKSTSAGKGNLKLG